MALARRILAIPVAALVAFRTAVQCLSREEVTGLALALAVRITTVVMPSSTSMLKTPTTYTDRLLLFSRVRRDCSCASNLDAQDEPERSRLYG